MVRRVDVHEREEHGSRGEAGVNEPEVTGIHHDLEQRPARRLVQLPLAQVDGNDLLPFELANHAFAPPPTSRIRPLGREVGNDDLQPGMHGEGLRLWLGLRPGRRQPWVARPGQQDLAAHPTECPFTIDPPTTRHAADGAGRAPHVEREDDPVALDGHANNGDRPVARVEGPGESAVLHPQVGGHRLLALDRSRLALVPPGQAPQRHSRPRLERLRHSGRQEDGYGSEHNVSVPHAEFDGFAGRADQRCPSVSLRFVLHLVPN